MLTIVFQYGIGIVETIKLFERLKMTDQQVINLPTIVRFHNLTNGQERYTFQNISLKQAIVTKCQIVEGAPMFNQSRIVNMAPSLTANMVWEKEFGVDTTELHR